MIVYAKCPTQTCQSLITASCVANCRPIPKEAGVPYGFLMFRIVVCPLPFYIAMEAYNSCCLLHNRFFKTTFATHCSNTPCNVTLAPSSWQHVQPWIVGQKLVRGLQFLLRALTHTNTHTLLRALLTHHSFVCSELRLQVFSEGNEGSFVSHLVTMATQKTSQVMDKRGVRVNQSMYSQPSTQTH